MEPLIPEQKEDYSITDYSTVYSQYDTNHTEQQMKLYRLQNIFAVIAVVGIIIMDIFELHISNLGAKEVFVQIQSSLWTDTLLPLVYKILSI